VRRRLSAGGLRLHHLLDGLSHLVSIVLGVVYTL